MIPLLLLALRLYLPGLFWTAAAPSSASARTEDFWARAGRLLFAGTLLNLLSILLLLSFGAWTPLLDWLLWALLTAAGMLRARRRAAPLLLRRADLLWHAALLFLLLLGARLLPAQSEWRMGGWDPGHYQNNAVRIAIDGHLRGPEAPLYASLSPEEKDLLAQTNYGGSYRAIADNLPVTADGSMPLYFFHLTSVAGAALYRLGGDAFLNRINLFLAWGLLLPLGSLLAALGLRGIRRATALLFWLLSPLFWYHQSFPTSEMLYLFLLMGGMADWLDSRSDPLLPRLPWVAWTACFLLVVNHLNTTLLVGGLVIYAAILEADARLPRRTTRVLGAMAALALGFFWNILFARITLLKLYDESYVIPVITSLFVFCILLALLFSRRPLPVGLRRIALRAVRVLGIAAAIILPIVALSSLFGGAREFYYVLYAKFPILGRPPWWLMRQAPFYGIPALLLAALGLAILAIRPQPRWTRLSIFLVAFGGLFLLILIDPGIKKLFPWALRRFFVYSLPLVTLAQTVPVLWALDAFARHRRRCLAALTLLASLTAALACLPTTLAAARVGDYPGFLTALRTLKEPLRPDDILVIDAPSWLAPFLVAEGHTVINGALLWESSDPAERAAIQALLRGLPARTGGRLLWLTTSRKGLAIYPEPPAVNPTPIAAVDFDQTTVIHGQRNRAYATETQTKRLRLYAP